MQMQRGGWCSNLVAVLWNVVSILYVGRKGIAFSRTLHTSSGFCMFPSFAWKKSVPPSKNQNKSWTLKSLQRNHCFISQRVNVQIVQTSQLFSAHPTWAMEQDTLYKALPTVPELCRANHSASGGVSSTSSISSFKHIQTTLYLGHFGAYLKRFDVVWVLSHHDLGQVDRSFFAWQTEGIEVPVRQKEATAGPAVIGSLSVAATAAVVNGWGYSCTVRVAELVA